MTTESTIYWLAVYGNFELCSDAWRKWLSFSDSLFELANLDVTHLAFKGDGSTGKHVVTANRARRKLLRQLEQDAMVEWVGIYCLPEDYHQAVFDFQLSISRRKDRLVFAIEKDILTKIGVSCFRETIQSFHALTNYFEAEASRHETLALLIHGLKDVGDYETIIVINDKRNF